MKKEFRTKLASILLTVAMVTLMILPIGMVAASADGYAYEPDNWDEKQISLGSATVPAGESVTLALRASDFTSAATVTLTLTFDSTKLSIDGATDGVLILSNLSVSNGVIGSGLTFTVDSHVTPGTDVVIAVACSDTSVTTVNGHLRVTEPLVPPVEPGDVDGNAAINIVDLTTLARYLANYNSETGTSSVEVNTTGADVNEDGTINITDLTTLAQYLASH